MSTLPNIRHTKNGPFVTLTLQRPEVHNALDEETVASLTAALQAASANPDVRAIVLRGAGPSFCAGADLAYMRRTASLSFEENLADAARFQQMLEAVWLAPKPVIAVVHGAAIGGGTGLAAAADLVIATPRAKFGFSEVRLGIVPALIGPYVARRIGLGRARAYFVTGERLGGADALRLGLVDVLVEEADLEAALRSRLEMIAQSGPEAVAAAKQLLRELGTVEPQSVNALTARILAERRASAEGQEGIAAFLEKRPAAFQVPVAWEE
jgi:methylglutaconyl-CoA hydratase